MLYVALLLGKIKIALKWQWPRTLFIKIALSQMNLKKTRIYYVLRVTPQPPWPDKKRLFNVQLFMIICKYLNSEKWQFTWLMFYFLSAFLELIMLFFDVICVGQISVCFGF